MQRSARSTGPKVEATTEEDIRRHMIEDGENPDREPRIEDIYTPQVIRKRLNMTQEQFAARLAYSGRDVAQLGTGRNRSILPPVLC